MTIAYIASSLIPSKRANSVHVMRMCQAFKALGHDVILIVPDYGLLAEELGDVFEYYGIREEFTIKKIKQLNPYLFAWYASKYARKHADLVYGRHLVGCFFSAARGLDTIYEAHGPERGKRIWNQWIFRRLSQNKNFLRLVVISEALKQMFLNDFETLESKIIVAHDGADENFFLKSETIDVFNVAYIGSLYKGRGIDIIVELARRISDVKFSVIGGEEKDVIFWKGCTKDIRNIDFQGFLEPSLVPQRIMNFDVLLAPYQHDLEIAGGGGSTADWMSPLKVFEYMAAGKPIVISDMPVIREILTSRETALFCEPDDLVSWEKSLRELMRDDNLRKTLGQEAQQKFVENYTWNIRAKGVMSFEDGDPENLNKIRAGEMLV